MFKFEKKVHYIYLIRFAWKLLLKSKFIQIFFFKMDKTYKDYKSQQVRFYLTFSESRLRL